MPLMKTKDKVCLGTGAAHGATLLFAALAAAFSSAFAETREAQKKDVEVVAVYYPHWHKYPKGTEWFGPDWENGEWAFVKSARPRFPGHHQPIVPMPGYLDGADPQDVAKEIALASNAGIDVFLYDYYFYNGQVTQEEAIEKGFLQAPNRNRMKFALMWCYHERFDQFRPDVDKPRTPLMSLAHTPEEFLGLIDLSIARYFNRPEYWCKDGKLFFSIYNAMYLWEKWGKDAAKVRAAIDEARRRVRAAGLGEMHFNAQNVRPDQASIAVAMGFDSLTDYGFGAGNAPNYGARVKAGEWCFDYAELTEPLRKHWAKMQQTGLPYFPIVPTGWDSSPRCRLDVKFPWPQGARYPYCGTITNNTPDLFEANLRAARDAVRSDPKKPGVVYINAWNEYTEGCYMLPDRFYTDGFLRAVASVFGRSPASEYVFTDVATKRLFTAPSATRENVAYGTHLRQKLDVFLPPGARGATPAVIYLHPGGWTGGARIDRIVGHAVRPLLDRGVAVVAVDYRYVQEAPRGGTKPPVTVCLEDCEAAVRFVQAHAQEWNIDVKRLALAGGSAGACTALYLGLKDDNALGFVALGPINAQTSLDPRQTRERIPNATYGGHAFGYRTFDDWLAHRADVLPWIEKLSPAALAEKVDSARAPKIFLQYDSIPAAGALVKDPTHSGAFGSLFKEICDRRGVACEVFVDPKPYYAETFRRLADALLK